MIGLVARALLAPILVVAAALLVKGATESGGGFAAGVVASLGVLVQTFAFGHRAAVRRLPWIGHGDRVALAGLAVMATQALLPVAWGKAPLLHWPRPGEAPPGFGAIEATTALVFEAGVALATFGVVVAVVQRMAETGRAGEDAP